MKLLNKITAKAICGKVKNLVPDTGIKNLYMIYGTATGYTLRETEYGDSPGKRIAGSFEAESMLTHERYRSGYLYLPGGAAALLTGLLDEPDATSIQFALMISVQASETVIGYEYVIEALTPPAQNDVLADIRRIIDAKLELTGSDPTFFDKLDSPAPPNKPYPSEYSDKLDSPEPVKKDKSHKSKKKG